METIQNFIIRDQSCHNISNRTVERGSSPCSLDVALFADDIIVEHSEVRGSSGQCPAFLQCYLKSLQSVMRWQFYLPWRCTPPAQIIFLLWESVLNSVYQFLCQKTALGKPFSSALRVVSPSCHGGSPHLKFMLCLLQAVWKWLLKQPLKVEVSLHLSNYHSESSLLRSSSKVLRLQIEWNS